METCRLTFAANSGFAVEFGSLRFLVDAFPAAEVPGFSHLTPGTYKFRIKAERNSAIDWTEGIRLEPFVINPDETTVIAHCGSRDYRLVTRMVEEHYITLATPIVSLRHGVGQ